MNIEQKDKERIVLALAAIIIIALSWQFYARDATYWWDESTYIGIGRFIETRGEIGFWENFRPPIIPLTIAILEIFKIPAPFERLIVSTTFSILLFFLTIKLAKKTEKETAHWALLLLLSAPVIIKLSPRLLSDIPSTAIIALSAILLFSNKKIPAGIIHGIAIMTRFPQIIYTPAFLLYIWHEAVIQKTRESIIKSTKKSIQYIIGISIILAPYMIFQKIKFGSFTHFMFYAQEVPKIGSAKLFPTISTFYFSYLTMTAILLPALIIGIIYYAKNYKTEKEGVFLTTATILMIGYLTQFPYREDRFLVMAMPFIAVISAKGLKIIINIAKNFKTENAILAIAVIIITMMIGQGIAQAKISMGEYTSQEKEYYKKISEIKTQKGQIILMAETDALALTRQKIKFLGGIQYAIGELKRLKPITAAFAWNNCTYACPANDEKCEKEKILFNEELEKMRISWKEKIGNCALTIYEISDEK
ncbi:glycosyltransferase family 39 protein [Candidatus Woesearchaeota archaeon]|nr:glycosyltransferase family 39 protein [Candidatus Woesearchaeota archaeon]